jgi:outer membrane receptor protein involved in Fe transport
LKLLGRLARGFLFGAITAFGVVGFLSSSSIAYAQGIVTGSISGTVLDSQGAVISSATITARESSTGVTLETKSNDVGLFSFRSVLGGSYTITIAASGFTELKIEHVVVITGQNSDIGEKRLAIGTTATVEVSAASALVLQTDQSQVATTFNTEEVATLPVNGQLDNLAELTPGVTKAHDASFSNHNGDNYSINGQRARSNNYELDGQSNNDNSVAGPQIIFANQDAIQEIQVITSNFSAQYGRNMGGVINYVTKNGTNQFHGSGYEFYTGSFLSSLSNQYKNPLLGFCGAGQTPESANCIQPTTPRYVDNRWGGTFGGPILKDKLWFFGGTNWKHTRQGMAPSISSNTTPDLNGLAKLKSTFPDNPAVNILATAGPFGIAAGNPIAVTPATQMVTVGTTTVPVEFARVQRSIPSLYNDQEDLGRVDWQPTEKDHLFVRYFYQNTNITGNGTINNGYFYDIPSITHSVGADWSHVFSPNWVNQIRYSFQQSKFLFQGGSQANCLATTPQNCTSFASIGNSVSFGYPIGYPQGRTVKVTQLQDNVSWSHGRHAISFGGDFTYQNSPDFFLPNYNGSFIFSNFNSFMSGIASTLSLADGNFSIPFTEPDFSLYFQDDYKVLPTLTLNLGLRYEFYSQGINLLHDETVARETGPDAFWDTTLPLSRRVYPYTNQFAKAFQPRLGFAWNPEQLHNLVVRGGYSIQFDPEFYNMFLNSATAAPVVNSGSIDRCGISVNCLPSSGFLGSQVRAQDLPLLPRGAGINPNIRNLTNNSPNFQNPYAQTYQLSVQYDIKNAASISAAYIGSHTSKQFQSLNANPYLLPIANAFPGYLSGVPLCTDKTAIGLGYGHENCDFTNVRTRANTAFSNYNSLQVQAKTIAWHGLTTLASYTFSRSIDNADEAYSAIASSGSSYSSIALAQNPLNTNVAERAQANISLPNVVSIGLVYTPTVYSGQHGLKEKLLGGFTFAPQYYYNSGQPWTPGQNYQVSTFSDPGGDSQGYSPNTTSFCDHGANGAYIQTGYDSCRPVLANRTAPLNTVGVYVVDPNKTFTTNGTGYYNYYSTDDNRNLNQPIGKQNVHWLYNNQAYAMLVGNPFPGVSRNTERGQSFNNLDLAIEKSTNVGEHVAVKLYMNVFNVLNRSFRGTPDTLIDNGASVFASTVYSGGNYDDSGVPASRYIQLGGKVTF